ncbi:MAG: hypothetical protein ACR2QA_11150 [Solirubrobacteraceae bacterium]
MHLVFDIFQGIGIAAAVGVRPFLPALAVGALAAGNIQIDFNGSDCAFLQGVPFLLVMLLGAVILAVAERRLAARTLEGAPAISAFGLAAGAVGALLFAGSLCRGHYALWPGIVGGVICAGVGFAATGPLLLRVRARLKAMQSGADGPLAGLLPLFTEGAALLLAVLSVLLPPVGPIGLALLVWLLFAGRGRKDQKYAGLRILR